MAEERSPLLESTLFDIFSHCGTDTYFFVCDVESDDSHWSAEILQDFDLPGEYMHHVTEYWEKLIDPEDLPAYRQDIFNTMNGPVGSEHNLEYRVRNRAGNYVWVRCRGQTRLDKGGRLVFAGVIRNMGMEPKYDSVTNLLTIHQWERRLQNELAKPNARGGVLLFGVDRFGRINDFHGYSFGNQVLRAFAEQLLAARGEGQIFRMDGDKFAYWLGNADGPDLELKFGEFWNLANTMVVDGTTLPFTLTGGYVLYPEHGTDAAALHSRLETALAFAKRSCPGNVCIFSEGMYRSEQYDNDLRSALRADIENHFANFELYYQPQIDAKTNRCIAAEALLRWHNPEFPGVGPGEFIPILEADDSILAVGDWVLRTGLEQLKRWQTLRSPFTVGVNMIYRQMIEPDFAARVCGLYESYQLPPRSLCLELTESCRVSNLQMLDQTLKLFENNGIQTSLDDFGTGYANFTVLRSLTPSWVKIDHSMVIDVVNSAADRAILSSLIDLAHKLNVYICVEGIENEPLDRFAKKHGADLLQGYYYSRPIPAREFEKRFLLTDALPLT